MFRDDKVINLIRRLFNKPLCCSDKSAVLHPTARIFNILGDVNSITIGAFTHIRGELLTFSHGGKISIGHYCYIGEGSRIWSGKHIVIGDRVLIAHNVNIFDNSTHPLNPKARHEHYKAIITSGHPNKIDLSEEPVVIKNDAWIGCMSIILPGVTIGEGAIVGAGSVVTKDVLPYIIVAGNPARIIRELTPEERA
ncbi:MAG: acyltransferase [Nitrospira sp.]|nr:acyltransferase [Nitrospira sp.]